MLDNLPLQRRYSDGKCCRICAHFFGLLIEENKDSFYEKHELRAHGVSSDTIGTSSPTRVMIQQHIPKCLGENFMSSSINYIIPLDVSIHSG